MSQGEEGMNAAGPDMAEYIDTYWREQASMVHKIGSQAADVSADVELLRVDWRLGLPSAVATCVPADKTGDWKQGQELLETSRTHLIF